MRQTVEQKNFVPFLVCALAYGMQAAPTTEMKTTAVAIGQEPSADSLCGRNDKLSFVSLADRL